MHSYVPWIEWTKRYICACTGWRRLIGSRKVQIIFHKRATKYTSLLRKMTYKDKGSYESCPPCNLQGARRERCILRLISLCYVWSLCVTSHLFVLCLISLCCADLFVRNLQVEITICIYMSVTCMREAQRREGVDIYMHVCVVVWMQRMCV